MELIFEDKNTSGLLLIHASNQLLAGAAFPANSTINTIVCNLTRKQTVLIDETAYEFPVHSILPLVANQHFVFEHPEELVAWQFNREFYCIADHDAEVGCAGFLFYGIEHPMFINIDDEGAHNILLLEKLFRQDIDYIDNMQGEMLRTLLKRLIITITRMAKKQYPGTTLLSDDKFLLVRKFNLLVETSFRKHHDVHFYAEALNKSPKTLSNVFGICGYPPPSLIIRQRIIMESKRYLLYTDKSAKEIAYELGFASPANFSNYFKKYTGKNISAHRMQE